MLLLFALPMAGQTRIDTIRYVKTAENGGAYTNNGRSWSTAKSDLQDAINDLHEYLKENNLTSGSIYVAAGTYKPSESTESNGGGLQFTSFKIYPGIHVYGGFAANESDDASNPFELNDEGTDYKYRPHNILPALASGLEGKMQPWNFTHKTILSGSHNVEPTFSFDETKGIYNTLFPGNSYHVVWFATEGFIPVTTEGEEAKHALPLSQPASIDGCTITGGYAATKSTTERFHTSYGGGVYLVRNATLSRCEIKNCEAIMRGGGAYLDGGGHVDRCYIHTCQSPGVGIMQGYGGGVCIDYDGSVTHSYIVNNVSRIGAGVTICHTPAEYPRQSLDTWITENGGSTTELVNAYSPHATACIISNNTATAEGAGIYFYEGGVGNHLTITRNNCVGQDITYYGRRHGRSGGVYILNGGYLYNSVIWGNKCEANDNIQYAVSTAGSTDDTGGEEGLKPKVSYSAIDRHDITDWAGTTKNSIMSLESTNTNETHNDAYYPYFIGVDGEGTMPTTYGAGLAAQPDPEDPTKELIPRPIYWKVADVSPMSNHGLQVTEAVMVSSQGMKNAHTDTDLFIEKYMPMSTLGALNSLDEKIGCVLVANQEKEIYSDKGYTQTDVDDYSTALEQSELSALLPDDESQATLPTIFVDPSCNASESGITIGEQNVGASWDKPVKNINDAIYYFKQRQWAKGTAYEFQYNIGGTKNSDGTFTDGTNYPYVQILVKGFERGSTVRATTVGRGAYLGSELRTAAIRPTSNMRIYGGYAPTSSGTTTTERNARTYPTIVTGNITNTSYNNNSAHIVALINVRNVIIDGLRLYEGNALLNNRQSYAPINPTTREPEDITYGGGLIMNNATVPAEDRIDMTGNILRNAYIANCSAPYGAAIYVNSSNKKSDNTNSAAELSIVNTIIRNNTVGSGKEDITDPSYGNGGVITARGDGAKIRIDHCNIVNNTGFPLETLATEDGGNYSSSNEGKIFIYNSVIYANGEMDYTNRKNIKKALNYHSNTNTQTNVEGKYIFLDWDAPKFANLSDCQAVFCRDMSEQYKKWGIRKMDENQMTVLDASDKPIVFYEESEAAALAHTECNSTPFQLDYPFFENPSKNSGHSEEDDKPMNGGIVSYMPQATNPMVNAAIPQSKALWDSGCYARTRGGDPDIGAIESRDLPIGGSVIYVTPNGAGRRDGSSWDNAIQGNAIYTLSGGAAGSDEIDAQNGARIINNSDASIGSLPGNGVPTSDYRYSGGFGRVWLTNWITGGSTNTTITKLWTTEKNYYDDGARQGEEEIVNEGTTPTETPHTPTVNSGSTPSDFTGAGYYDDQRYPYGEISGASRSFWRANPYHNGTDWNNAANYENLASFIDACNANGWINNARTENYIGGLQYAVEKAAAYNALPEDDPERINDVDSIIVWVGNGKYTDYKGFVMRDNTTVMGGFPVEVYGTPGLNERQALMSNVVNIPASQRAKDYNAEDYETILQISDTDPKIDNEHLNEAAVPFWDNDYSLVEHTNTITTEYKNRNIVHHFKWETSDIDKTSDYLMYPTFNGVSFTPTAHDEGGFRYYTFGNEVAGKDQWHLMYPIKPNYVVNIENNANNKNKKRTIYDPETNQILKESGVDVTFTGNWIFLGNGSLTGTEFWQTMPNVPAGSYRLYVDMAGGYRNKFSSTDPTKIFFKILASDGTTDLIAPVMLKTIGSFTNDTDRERNRNMAYRYALDFTQPTTGNVTIKIVVEDGVRNTTANNATYGTPTGGDPDPIPNAYTTNSGENNPNRREFWMSNLRLVSVGGRYEEDMAALTDQETERAPSETVQETETIYTSQTERKTLRKRVLTMPDICTPTYGAGTVGNPTIKERGKFGDDLCHTDRVNKESRTSTEKEKCEDPHYVEYNDVVWDGFTIRHGFISEEAMAHGGGAGVNMYEGAHLKNCIITNNISYCERVKGAGIFCDGSNSTIEGCFVLNNTATHGALKTPADQNQIFSGGMFMYEGTCFNSLFAKNHSYGSAGGVGFCVGRFYNNTIAYNTCDLVEGGHVNGGAISIATASKPNLFLANTIVYGNSGMAIRERYKNDAPLTTSAVSINSVNPFINCYIQTEVPFIQDIYKKNIGNHSDDAANFGIGNVLLDGVAPSAANTPFSADLDNELNYTGDASTLNDFRLTNENLNCINSGTQDFSGSLFTVLKYKYPNWTDANIKSQFIYKSVEATKLPATDVAYADRIQDCQIDIGAYEYDGTKEIKPSYELINFDPEQPDERDLCAVYYVGPTASGLATGQSPDNAACSSKLQYVLDAAGRLKADLAAIKAGTFTEEGRYSTSQVDLSNNVIPTYEEVYEDGTTKEARQITASAMSLSEVAHVIVKLSEGTYRPLRSTNEKMVTGDAEEVMPMRSIMVPHGVEVMGGYTYDGSSTDFYETYRDPLNNKTIFSGYVINQTTDVTGQAYHVMTFTNDIYGPNNLKLVENGLSTLTDRAVADGISIEDGLANGTDEEDKGGGACIVSDFAHVRNCIIQNNEATSYGGGLYLMPGALVSGCVMLNNKAEYGGAIYVKEPEASTLPTNAAERDLYYSRIYNTTIVRNDASVRGGGIWYDTNIRAKGVVLWQNTANDMNNVAGVFDTEVEQNESNYPFAYCAVQTRRLPGVNNFQIQAESERSVRWSRTDTDDMRWRGDKPTYSNETNKEAYYYIEKLSSLVRSGMPYSLYRDLRSEFPTLELRDMAGVSRVSEFYDRNDAASTIGFLKHINLEPYKKSNGFLEIGARALNFQMGSNFNRPFTRLYVANYQYVDNEKATALLESGDPLYSQQGSSMANPFQKFSDALDYIVGLRNYGDDNAKNIYRDTRFEIFIAGGTYYPTHNARGIEGHARSSTFILPEGVTITGGLNPNVFYCQKGYNFPFLQPTASATTILSAGSGSDTNDRTEIYTAEGSIQLISGITLKEALTNTIWEERQPADINGNNVYEPWEFQYATTFSGETPRGTENEDNVYHVFTCMADPNHVGTLPRRFSSYIDNGNERFSGELGENSDGTEHTNSELHRMIIFNGVNITNGNARDFESESIKNLSQYYRGGGILVDGNWKNADLDSGKELDLDDGGNIQYEIDGHTPKVKNIEGYDPAPDAKGMRDIPMMLVRSQFQNSSAIQGGAVFTNGSMNVFGCSFVQNYTEGPTHDMELTDYIKYTGGGAIATNGDLRISNSIFANNEAMLGKSSVQLQSSAPGYEKQAFGGAIWGGSESNIRLTNCNIVNNKSVSYPCVYINRGYGTEAYDPKRFAANTIFWGNAITGENSSTLDGFNITDINRDVFSYRTQAEKEAEEAGNADYSTRQPMFFCAYRETYGPTPQLTEGKVTIPTTTTTTYGDTDYIVPAGEYDPHEVPFMGEDINYWNVFQGNNNINITEVNEGVDGPNFVLPSTSAGKNGHNPAANWMPSRINNLTDNGWGYLTMTSKTASGDIEFKRIGASEDNTGGSKPEDVVPDNNVSGGLYNFYSWMLRHTYHQNFMPVGEQYYMKFKNANMTDSSTGGESHMLRISSNPLTIEEAKAYIDFGVYEYQHRNLRINQNSEIDILWVAETEDLEKGNDGYTWNTPTSNLQAAIETLLKSRNDHAKQINIIAGEYKPMAIIGDNKDQSLSFTVQTRFYNNGSFTPFSNDHFYGIRSLTFRGGYDKEVPEETGYDFNKNKVTLSVERRTSVGENQMNHIVSILDAEQYTTNVAPDSGEKNHNNTGHAIPITFEGITFNNTKAKSLDTTPKETNQNNGGAAIYYREQTKLTFNSTTNKWEKGTELLAPPASGLYDDSEPKNWIWNWTTPSGEPKLTLRNCTFTQNGDPATASSNPTSAVYVEGGGGSSLIVNSLFERNSGDPIVAVNTTVLNSTFGKNGGHLKLTESVELGTQYRSKMHNNAIWRDNQNDGEATPQYEGITDASRMTYNAITGLPMTADAQKNYGLSDTNEDVLQGPNFLDPDNGDYHLKPSKRLMNQGLNSTYANFVWPKYPSITDYEALMRNMHEDQSRTETRTTRIQNGDHEEIITYEMPVANKDFALGFTPRLLSMAIDRGAYECINNGQRVIYMNPNKTGGTETGRTWEEAYGQGKLQTAIDAATIYAGDGMAYVFVKGQNESNSTSEQAITFRDGVNVYGGIQNTSNPQAVPKDATKEELEYTSEELDAFVNRIKSERRGIAAENATPTQIKGINSVAGTYDKGAVIDGFWITNSATETTPATSPIVNITIPNVALRNSIVTGNTMSEGQPVVNLSGGSAEQGNLLYNTLVYGNTAGTLVNVGAHSYILNCTIVAENEGETPIGGDGASTNVQNTIAAIEADGKAEAFAPYQRPTGNAYTPATFLTNHRPYWYQLQEESPAINGGTDDGTTAKNGGNTIAALFPDFVNFDHDRDLLGNPRRLGGKVDNGAFETWKVSGDVRYATNETNGKTEDELNKYVCDIESTSDPRYALEFNNSKMLLKKTYWEENYGGHLYPHLGSVVYIESGSALSFERDDDDNPLFPNGKAIRPGYLLVKEGGSLYGNGNVIQAEYVAAERTMGGQYGLLALPFDYDIANAYTAADGTAAQTNCQLTTADNAFYYDGAERSEWDYHFKDEDSECWKPLPSTSVAANDGWLIDLEDKTNLQTVPIRFTGWAATSGQYAYTEDGTTKTVTLTQYDDRTSTNGRADFTRQENMGWNLKGVPFLVSDYQTSTLADDTYQMNVPHVIYSTLDTNDATYGQFYTAQSWANGATLALGKAFFTQTAVIGDTETLYFKQPVYEGTAEAPVKESLMLFDEEEQADAVELHPQDGADAAMSYRLGSDGVKWFSLNDEATQLYVVNGDGTPLSLVSAAPVETEIPLGIRAGHEGRITIALPSPDVYADYDNVWLTDHEAGISTDLRQGDYVMDICEAGIINNRLTLKFGGMPELARTEGPAIEKLAARGGRLPLRRYAADDLIRIHTASGALVYRGRYGNFSNSGLADGIYIIER